MDPTAGRAHAERTSSDALDFIDSGTSPSISPTILIPESFFSAIMDLASSEWPTSSKSSVASLPDNVASAAGGLSGDSAQPRRSSTAKAWARRATVKHTRDLHHDLLSTGMLAKELGDIVSLAPDRQPDLMAHACSPHRSPPLPASTRPAPAQRPPSARSRTAPESLLTHLLLFRRVLRNLLPCHLLRHHRQAV